MAQPDHLVTGQQAPGRAPPGAPRRHLTQKWTRRLHMWTSMTSLLIVLFFSLTGITLNHPDWTFGQPPVSATVTGALPEGAVGTDGPDLLAVSEFLRSQHRVRGSVTDHSTAGGEASISYRGPGYAADVLVRTADSSFTLTTRSSGFVAIMNDLHKGRNTSTLWTWVIDITAGLLVMMSLTGIVLQATMKRRRRTALLLGLLGTAACVGLIWVSV